MEALKLTVPSRLIAQPFIEAAAVFKTKADAATSGGTDDRSAFHHAERPMLEIRPAPTGYIVFDTDEQEAIMRFGSYADAANLVADLVIAESREQLQAWWRPMAPVK